MFNHSAMLLQHCYINPRLLLLHFVSSGFFNEAQRQGYPFLEMRSKVTLALKVKLGSSKVVLYVVVVNSLIALVVECRCGLIVESCPE